jgi:hypothetical protein
MSKDTLLKTLPNGIEIHIAQDDMGMDIEDLLGDLPTGTIMYYQQSRDFGPSWSFAECSNEVETSNRKSVFTCKCRVYGNTVVWYCPQSTINAEWDGDCEKARNYYKSLTDEINSIIDGDVWGYVISYMGETLSSCYGYIGREYVEESALSEASADWSEECLKILADKQSELDSAKSIFHNSNIKSCEQ